LAGRSKKEDDLERLAAVVDFALFRPELERAVPRADRAKGGRPPFDHVLMFKVLVLQTQNNLSDERTEFYLRDRLTGMRFLGLGLGDAVPDANTIWTFREALTKAGAIERLFELFDRELRSAAISPCPGNWLTQASSPRPNSVIPRPRSRRSGQVACRMAGRTSRPSSARRTAMRAGPSRRPRPNRARARRRWSTWQSPSSATKTIISADRRHRLIRRWLVTDASAYGGARLADLLDPGNTASDVWADTGYRSRKNEALLRQGMLTSHIHRKKPTGRPMPPRTARATAKKSAIRAHIEHVFAEQKARMGLFVRTIGLARATSASPT
jgi:IS5 family transposase